MHITIIDGFGGKLGAELVSAITAKFAAAEITAIGTNAVATAAMLKAGAKNAATGENPLIVSCRRADIIIGPIGIVVADAMLGEITPKMAVAVGQANATRILIPVNRCDNIVAGVREQKLGPLLDDVMARLEALLSAQNA